MKCKGCGETMRRGISRGIVFHICVNPDCTIPPVVPDPTKLLPRPKTLRDLIGKDGTMPLTEAANRALRKLSDK